MKVAAALVTVMVAAGCSTTVTGSPLPDPAPAPTEGPGSDPVPWADHICGAMLAFSVPVGAPADVAPTSDLPTIKTTVTTYLGAIVTGVRDGRTQLDAVGRAPVEGGDAVLGRLKDGMAQLETDFAGVQATIDAADPTNVEAFLASLNQAETALNGITTPDALGEMSAIPRLRRAVQEAAQCQQLAALGAAPPR